MVTSSNSCPKMNAFFHEGVPQSFIDGPFYFLFTVYIIYTINLHHI